MSNIYFDLLPEELIQIIGYNLNTIEDILNLSKVDNNLNSILSKPYFWIIYRRRQLKLTRLKKEDINIIDVDKFGLMECVISYEAIKNANIKSEMIINKLEEDLDRNVGAMYGATKKFVLNINLSNINLFNIPQIDYDLLLRIYRKNKDIKHILSYIELTYYGKYVYDVEVYYKNVEYEPKCTGILGISDITKSDILRLLKKLCYYDVIIID